MEPKVISDSKKIKKNKSKKSFDSSCIKSIIHIGYPERTEFPLSKTYKMLTRWKSSKDGKIHDKTIYFGDRKRDGCEFIDHGNEDIKIKYIKNLDQSKNFYDKNFMNKFILNGEKKTLTENWELLKDKYINN